MNGGFADFAVSFLLPTAVLVAVLMLGMLSTARLRALYLREILSLMVTPSIYVVLTLHVILNSFVFYVAPMQYREATFDPMIQFMKFLGIFFVPLLTMRLFAEERRTGTVELLMTAPVRPVEVVLAKYGAGLSAYLLMISPCLVYVGLLMWAGPLDVGLTQMQLLGLVLLGITYVAAGLFVSSLTRSQIAAAMGTMALLLGIWLSWWLGSDRSSLSGRIWRGLSFKQHFDHSLSKGVLDTGDVVYFILATLLFIFLSWLVLRASDDLGRMESDMPRPRHWTVVLLALVAAEAAFVALAALDVGQRPLNELMRQEGGGELLGWVLLPFAVSLFCGAAAMWLARMMRLLAFAGGVLALVMVRYFLPPELLTHAWLPILPGVLIFAAIVWGGLCRLREMPTRSAWCVGGLGLAFLALLYLPTSLLGVLLLVGAAGWFINTFMRRSAPTAITLLAVVMIIINIAVLAGRYSWRQDLTDTGLNRLDANTQEVLQSLEVPTRIQVFFTDQEDYDGFPLLTGVRNILDEYMAASERISVEYVDPYLTPLKARELGAKAGLELSRLPGYAVVWYGERKMLLPWQMIVTRRPNAMGKKQLVFQGELAFTTTLRRLIDPRVARVYFTTGHGEYNTGQMSKAPRGMGMLVRELNRYGYETERLSFMDSAEIPADCDLLVMAGPFVPFRAADLAALRSYFENGGRALIMLDPRAKADPHNPLNELLREYGIEVRDNLLFDPQHNANGDPTTIQVKGSPSHPLTGGGTEVRCYLVQARALAVKPGAKGWKSEQVLLTSDRAGAYQVADNGKLNLLKSRGPFACAVSATGPQDSRILVIGDTDMAGNFSLEMGQNQSFLITSARWLSRRSKELSIPERIDVNRSFVLTRGQRRVLWWVALLGIPQIFLLAGVTTWWIRRQ